MSTQIDAWQMTTSGQPMNRVASAIPSLGPDEALIRIAACGVCHTDLGFYYDGVRTVSPLPLTLGHEISGQVVDTGLSATAWKNKFVLIPAVLPCGTCEMCQAGQPRICRHQKMPGNHIHGGFASHIVVPAHFLCPVEVGGADELFGKSGVTLRELCAIADAITTPFQSIKQTGLIKDDVAIFVGAGGVGGFGIQIAQSIGAHVVVIDVDDKKLEIYKNFGAELTFNPKTVEPKEMRKSIQAWVQQNKYRSYGWKIYETSGTAKGQELAFGLLTFGSVMGVIGFTLDAVQLRLSNLMAFDAKAIGNWGCEPGLYPEVLQWVKEGRIQIAPFVQKFPMSEINSVFDRLHHRQIDRRPILLPDFS
ncbi:MAG TPA: 6-hydroxycyclohex-1-ene-1-carbonyl-CoA dehydrogenase [bacterium]|nr:6-hydroxycyclohex-1-ene-1-carbonyl-CoA dehydrogenase [bacterium]